MNLQQFLTERFGGESVEKEEEIGRMLADPDARRAGLELWEARQTGLLLGPRRDEEFTLHVDRCVQNGELEAAVREYYEREDWVVDADALGMSFMREGQRLYVTISNYSDEPHPCIMVTVCSGD